MTKIALILPADKSPNGCAYIVCKGYHPDAWGSVGDWGSVDSPDPFIAMFAQERAADASRYHCYRIDPQADGSMVLVRRSKHDVNPSEALRQALESDVILPALRAAEAASFNEGMMF